MKQVNKRNRRVRVCFRDDMRILKEVFLENLPLMAGEFWAQCAVGYLLYVA